MNKEKLTLLKKNRSQLVMLSELAIHEVKSLNRNARVMRVPGGFVYEYLGPTPDHRSLFVTSSSFVPETVAISNQISAIDGQIKILESLKDK